MTVMLCTATHTKEKDGQYSVYSRTHLFELFNGCLFILFTLFRRSLHLLGSDLEIDELFFERDLVSHGKKETMLLGRADVLYSSVVVVVEQRGFLRRTALAFCAAVWMRESVPRISVRKNTTGIYDSVQYGTDAELYIQYSVLQYSTLHMYCGCSLTMAIPLERCTCLAT